MSFIDRLFGRNAEVEKLKNELYQSTLKATASTITTIQEAADKLADVTDFSSSVEKSRHIWYDGDLPAALCECLVSTACSGVEIICEDNKVKTAFDYWASRVNGVLPDQTMSGLDQVIEWMFREYWQSGLLVPYCVWENDKTEKSIISKWKFPLKISIINPLSIKQSGTAALGGIKYSLSMENTDLKDILEIDDDTYVDTRLSPDKKELTNDVPLPLRSADSFYVIKYASQPYTVWPRPYLQKMYKWYDFKGKLRDMDYQTAISVMLSIILFKIVSNNPKDKAAIKTDILNNLGRHSVIATSANIEHEIVSMPVESLLSWDKYREADMMILDSLGLINFEGTTREGSRGRFNPAIFLSEIQRAQKTIKRLLERMFFDVCQKNGFKTVPNLKFKRVRLFEDSSSFRQFVRELYDRGVLSQETYADEADADYSQEVARRKYEKQFESIMQVRETFRQGVTGRGVTGVPPGAGRPDGTPNEQPKKETSETEEADYQTEDYIHLDNPDISESDVDEWVGTINVTSGIKGRLVRLKSTGHTAIKVYLFSKDKYTMDEAKKWLAKH